MLTKKILSQIFVRISSLKGDPSKLSSTKATHWSAFLLGFSFLILCSCSTTKQVQTVPVETIRKDTIYLSNIQYDSIYIYQDNLIDRSRDTLYIQEKSVEYRYNLLRDTIKTVLIDSIPYEVKIIETKEVYKPPNLFDYLCYLSFGILIGITGWKLIKFIPSRH